MAVAEIDVLKQQQAALYDQINAINQGQATGDIQSLQNELNAVSNKISELEYAQKLQAETEEIKAQYETMVEETKAKTAYLLDTLEIEGLSISQLSASAEAYDILRQGLQQFIDKKDADMLDQLKTVKEDAAKTIAELKKQNDELNEAVRVKTEQYAALKNDYNAAIDEVNDLTAKRTAASKEIEESKAEIERLNSQIEDLQIEKAIGAKAATQVINGNDDLKAKADAFKAELESKKSKLPAAYNFRQHPKDNGKYIATLAETNEDVEGYWAYKNGTHREVTPEQAETFRTEYLAKQAAAEAEHVGTDSNGSVAVEEQPVTVPAFREEDSTTSGLVDPTSNVAGTTVTREEFESLKSRVAAIEAGKVNAEAERVA